MGEQARAGRPSTFASLRVDGYRDLFAAGILIFLAVQAQQVARGQLAFDLTGTNTGLGAVYLGFGLPMLLITPFAGVAADRLPKRTVLLVAQSLLVLSAAWVSLASAFGVLEYWMLVGSAVLQGAGFSAFGPARVAFTGELVPRPLIGNAVALTQMSLNSTRVFAPALAGVLIAVRTVGTTGVYLCTTVLMALSLVVTWRLPRRDPAAAPHDRSARSELAEGIRYAWRDPLLRALILSSFVMVMVGWPYLAFLPSVANDLFDAGSTGLGLLSSVSAVAALLVSVWIAGRSRPSQAWRIQSVSGAFLGVGLVLVALSPSFAACTAALFVVGGAASGYQAMNNTIVLTVADLEYHGRVQSLLMLSFSGFGMAALPLGAVADGLGLRTTFAAMGATCVATMGVYALVQARLRRSGRSFDLEGEAAAAA